MYVKILCITKEKNDKINCQHFECNFCNRGTSFYQKRLSLYMTEKSEDFCAVFSSHNTAVQLSVICSSVIVEAFVSAANV
jgi:hypothetical protein